MTPQLGQSVHFVGHSGECCAALITEVAVPGVPGYVSLVVFPPADGPMARTAKQDETTKARGTWHLPEAPTQEIVMSEPNEST